MAGAHVQPSRHGTAVTAPETALDAALSRHVTLSVALEQPDLETTVS
jgi:hypothetical protein